MALKPVSPLNLERYELKFKIPFHLVDPITEYVSRYCEMDYYSQISPDGFYVINSLYLDTPNFHIYRRRETGEMEYSGFRIRSYGSDPKPPYYFESKQKNFDFCNKRRSKVSLENFGDLIEAPWRVKDFDPYADKNLRDFLEKAITFDLRPVIFTQYRRRALLSTVDDYARVTFDRDMRYMEETEYRIRPDESRMTHYDHPETFDQKGTGGNVVLELKCERKIPLWMIDIIRVFNLERSNFSKFKNSVYECYGRPNELIAQDVMTVARNTSLSWR